MQLLLSTPSPQLQVDLAQSILFRVAVVETAVSGCCDFIAQCILVRINHLTHSFYSPKSSKIYRCWIVWRKNIPVIIIPSFLAITYIGQSIYFHLISRFEFMIVHSYLASVRQRNDKGSSRQTFKCSLGEQAGSNRFGRIHDRECPGDGLDRVQNPRGVLGT